MTFKKEFFRQILHFLLGLFLMINVAIIDKNSLLHFSIYYILASFLLVFVVEKIKPLKELLINAKRKDEYSFTALPLFFLGFFIFSALYNVLQLTKTQALIALFPFAISDAFSSLIGKAFGKLKLAKKSFEGSLTFFLMTFFFSFITSNNLYASIIFSIFVTFVENIAKEDNIEINIASPIFAKFLF